MAKKTMEKVWGVCRRLEISDPRNIEVESKRRVVPEQAKALRKYLTGLKGVRHEKKVVFYDQFLDTPDLRLLKMGVSLRLRYKGDGADVYLQYKGPGFRSEGLLYRSEFSSKKLEHVVREESHHDIVQFNRTSIRQILARHVGRDMAQAMKRHLGASIISSINRGPILCSYQKDKFSVDLGDAYLEPSLDRLMAFHINHNGFHSVSTFWEYEDEIKTDDEDLETKIEHLEDLLSFDRKIVKRFDLKPERFDKYRRLASCFLRLAPAPHHTKPRRT